MKFKIRFRRTERFNDMTIHVYNVQDGAHVTSRHAFCQDCRYNDQSCIENKCKPQSEDPRALSFPDTRTIDLNLDRGRYYFVIEASYEPNLGALLMAVSMECGEVLCQSSVLSSLDKSEETSSRVYEFRHPGGRFVLHTCAPGTSFATNLTLASEDNSALIISSSDATNDVCGPGRSYIERDEPSGFFTITVERAEFEVAVGDFELVVECGAYEPVADIECGGPSVTFAMADAHPLNGNFNNRFPFFRWFHPGGSFSISTCNPGTNFNTVIGIFRNSDRSELIVANGESSVGSGCSTIEVDRGSVPMDGGVYFIGVTNGDSTDVASENVELTVAACGEVQCGRFFYSQVPDEPFQSPAVYRMKSNREFYHVQTCFTTTEVSTSVRVFVDSSLENEAARYGRESCDEFSGENAFGQHPAADSGEFYVAVGGTTSTDVGEFKIYFECRTFNFS